MALVYKTINLWAFRDNNVHILCFAGENLGKEIRFKLINADGSVLELNSSDKVNFYWHPEGYNQSHYIEGLIPINESGIVSIPVTKEICSVSGRISCVLEVNRAGTTTKFGSINIDITDGVGSIDISNLNPAEYDLIMTMQGNIGLLQKKINDLALNNDPNAEIVEAKGVSSTLKNKIANYDTFAMFPNQAINCIKNSKNFINTDNWESVNTGTLTATGYSLKAVSEDNFGIYGSLEKDLSINYNKTIMVKARVRCVSGTSCTVKPCWRKNINGVLIAPEYIAAGNMDVSTVNNSVSWNLPTGKRWRDIWFIAFDGGLGTTINQIGFFISSGTTVEIGHFEVFYSQDEGLTNGELEDLQSDVNKSRVDIGNLQTDVNGTEDSAGLKTRMSAAESNITALQGVVNGSADVSGTVKNQIAAAKTDVINNSVNPLANRVTEAEKKVAANETNITNLQKSVKSNADNISTLRSDYDSDVFAQKNLLPNARTLKTNDNTITGGTLIENGFKNDFGFFDVRYAEILKDSAANYVNILSYNNAIKNVNINEKYTLSFYAKGNGRIISYFNNGAVEVKSCETSQGKTFSHSDGYCSFEISEEWQRFYVTYTMKNIESGSGDKHVLFRLLKSDNAQKAYIAAPQLVLGSDIKTDTDRNTAAVAQNTADIAALQAITGYTSDDILGLQVDYQNKTFTRLAGAVGKEAGADFDSFAMYGGRRRCNVANDGTINAYYGDEGYKDDGSNGQVMVYQPAFYYKVVPLKLDKNTDSGIGCHIRKANYYVSATPHAGFKLHPAFYDENGNAVDYILYSAYEGSLYSNHHIVSDDNDTETTWDLSADYLCSYANTKPISGLYKPLTKTNAETLAKNNGSGWHIDTIKSVSANQLLMMIELGTMNTQSAIGMGVVSITDNSSYNCSSFTGSTAALGNTTGMAESTVNRQGSTTTTYTENGKVSVSYRGIENPWGNINKHINGVNIWGDGTMLGGQPYIADGFSFDESSHSGNYKSVGFTLPNSNGMINAIGYGGEDFDWLIMPSEIGGTSALPVGDYVNVITGLNVYRSPVYGGYYAHGLYAGGYFYVCNLGVGIKQKYIGARLLYIPTTRI